MQPDDEALFADILIASRLVQSFMAGRSRDDLDEDLQLQFAVRKGIEIIGEAAGRLSEAAKTRTPAVPWREIVGMRHRLIHDYGRINLDVVWEAVSEDIPLLITTIEPSLDPEGEE